MVGDDSSHGNIEGRAGIHGQGSPDGVLIAEIFIRDGCGDDGRIARRQGVPRISLEHGVSEHRERTGIREREALLVEVPFVPGDEGPSPGEETGEVLDLGKLAVEGFGERDRRCGRRENPVPEVLFDDEAVDAFGVPVVLLVAKFVSDEEQDEDEHGQADRQPGDVKERISLVLPQIPQGRFEGALEHDHSPRRLSWSQTGSLTDQILILPVPIYAKPCLGVALKFGDSISCPLSFRG